MEIIEPTIASEGQMTLHKAMSKLSARVQALEKENWQLRHLVDVAFINDKKHSEDSWRSEITLRGWNGAPVILGFDAEGDIGILDDKGYSIIIDKRDLPKLQYWIKRLDILSSPDCI